MHYSVIKPLSIENGPGCRVSLFVSGCRNCCTNCFQKETWDFNYGNAFDEKTEDYILSLLKNQWIQGITLLGGEPFEKENQEPLLHLVKRIKEELPDKDIWAYSGCTLEMLLGKKERTPSVFTNFTPDLLKNIDVLVDGPFIEEKKDISLAFRGSSNQRIIDLRKSLTNNSIEYWSEEI